MSAARRQVTTKAMQRARPVAASSLALLLLLTMPTAARADTIYLTNGRVIHTSSVRIEGDLVIFQQLGGEVSIPRSAVARIVEDDEIEEPTRRRPDDAPAPDATATEGSGGGTTPALAEGEAVTGSGETGAAATGNVDAGDPAAATEPDDGTADDPSSATYWAAQIVAVDERIARAEAELDKLPYYDAADRRLLRFSGQARYFMAERDRWEELLRDFQATRSQLMEGARRAGITAGALRDALARAAAGGDGAGGDGAGGGD